MGVGDRSKLNFGTDLGLILETSPMLFSRVFWFRLIVVARRNM